MRFSAESAVQPSPMRYLPDLLFRWPVCPDAVPCRLFVQQRHRYLHLRQLLCEHLLLSGSNVLTPEFARGVLRDRLHAARPVAEQVKSSPMGNAQIARPAQQHAVPHVVGRPEKCINGRCAISCPSGMILCGAHCIDPSLGYAARTCSPLSAIVTPAIFAVRLAVVVHRVVRVSCAARNQRMASTVVVERFAYPCCCQLLIRLANVIPHSPTGCVLLIRPSGRRRIRTLHKDGHRSRRPGCCMNEPD